MDHHLHIDLPLLSFSARKIAMIGASCLLSVVLLLQFDFATAQESDPTIGAACGKVVSVGDP